MRILAASFFIILLAGAGCATSRQPAAHYPTPQSGDFMQEGIASWYGPGFHGRKTASGERYNQSDLTCAHRTLPFGTQLKVTNLSNGQDLLVTVNDRGPYIRPRIVDLSHEAAKQLDFIHEGTTRVRLETLPPSDIMDVVGVLAEADPDSN